VRFDYLIKQAMMRKRLRAKGTRAWARDTALVTCTRALSNLNVRQWVPVNSPQWWLRFS
jgi:hypothetical protein